MTPDHFDADADGAAAWVAAQWNRRPRFGIVLGTGSGLLAERVKCEAAWPFQEVPGLPSATALGHQGRLVCGLLAGQPVMAMQGRFHLYEGHSVERATLPLRVMQRLGVEIVFLTNAAGGTGPHLQRGDMMVISSVVDFMLRSSPAMVSPTMLSRPLRRGDDACDRELAAGAHAVARREGFPLHEGVYAGLLGPNYETRAEYRMLRRIGADAVGMSTVPEIAVATAIGLRVLAMSVISNVASPDELGVTSGEEVIEAAALAAPRLQAIVERLIAELGTQGSGC